MAEAKAVSVRFPEDLLERIKEEADRGELTVSGWIIEAVKSKLRGGDPGPEMVGAEPKPRPPLGPRGVPFTPVAQAKPVLVGYDARTGEPIYRSVGPRELPARKGK